MCRRSRDRLAMSDISSDLQDLQRLLAPLSTRVALNEHDALGLDPKLADGLTERGGGLAELGHADALRLGCVRLAHGDLDGARAAFERAAEADDKDLAEQAGYGVGLVAADTDDHDTAKAKLASLCASPFALERVRGRVGEHLRVTAEHPKVGPVAMELFALDRPLLGAEREALDARASAAKTLAAGDGVVGVLEVLVQGERVTTVGASVDGRSFTALDDWSPATLAARFGSVCDTLARLHEADWCHGELNPELLYLSGEEGDATLLELGPALNPGSPSLRARARRGALAYLAPERLAGAAPSAAADLYALAASAYRCLVGEAPSGGVPAPSSRVPALDGRVDALLRQALDPDPARRGDLAAFRSGLEALTEPAPEQAPVEAASEDVPVPVAKPELTGTMAAAAAEPSDPDDLDGWLAVLRIKPTHLPAREAVSRLERAARDEGRWDLVAEVLEVRAELSQAEGETVMLLRELAEIAETKLQAPGMALDALGKLVGSVSVNAQLPVVDELLRLGEVTGRWAEVAGQLRGIGARLPKLADQLRVLRGAAKAYLDQAGDLDSAIAVYEQALELEAENVELLHEAIAAYRKGDFPAELATSLLTVAELETGATRHAALIEAAELLGALGEHEGALEASEHVRAEDPDNATALEASERWARELERKDLLASILPQRAAAELDAAQKRSLHLEAAELLRGEGRMVDAIAQYRAVVEANPSDAETAKLLAELLRPLASGAETLDGLSSVNAREGLIDALSVLAEGSEDLGRKGELLAEVAALLDREADGGERAADCRERIVATLPIDHALVAAAVDDLSRYYRSVDAHDTLAELLERRAKSAALEPGMRIHALRELRELSAGPLADPMRECEVLEQLMDLDPGEGRWRDLLIARLREAGEDERAEELLRERLEQAADGPEERAEMLVTMARMREQAGALDEAEARVREALELHDGSSAGWALLRDILEQRERPLEALEALVRAAQTSTDPGEKVRGLFAAAKKWATALSKPERALPLLRELVALDPHHEEATALFTELLVDRGDLGEALPHAERWVTQLRAGDPNNREANARAHALAGRCALAAHDKDKARELLRVAKEFDPRNREVARALADLELESENWDAALKAYQGLAMQASQGEGEVRTQAELYLRMGLARRGLGELAKAHQMIDRALDLDPGFGDAARLLVELADAPAKQVEAQKRLLSVLETGLAELDGEDERRAARETELLDLRLALASTLAEDLNRPEEAVEQMSAVIAARPDDVALLHKALDLYSNAEQWAEAVDILDRLAAFQESGPILAKYRYAAASLIRANELDPTGGVLRERLLGVLEADPLHDKAFTAVVEELRQAGEAKELSKVLRARLKALPETGEAAPARVELLESLGALYQRELGDPRTAMIAYEQAVALARSAGIDDPQTQLERRQKIIGLSVKLGADALDKGIEQVQAVITDNPLDYDSYHRLVELFLAAKQRDAAIAVSRTLRFLKQADEAELELAAELGDGYQPPRGTVARKAWRDVLMPNHPSTRLSDLYGLLWPVMGAREGQRYSSLGLERGARESVTMQASGVARWVAYIAQVLDMPAPDLFLRKGTAGGFTVTALNDATGVYPTVLAGDDALGKQPEAALAFRAGRAIARSHPYLLGASLLPSSGSLRDVIYGAVALTHPQVAIPKELRDRARSWGELIQKMLPPSRLDDTRKAVAKVIESGGADTKAWLRGSEHTAARVGFLMSDNIESASRLVLQGGPGGQVEGRELIKGLIAFSVSSPYLQLRRSLKLGR
ncbi:tetratricopeptide repeat protein [Plesiocystis pacifica SIR-1]|uniref:Tetratricopeptide repeat protein n=2 Tax=Plesiocystis pacifica TaxID=191768 RepID=A6G6M2_9BACT|nr:tetratricopeptide repeat protein [Plesiocystis pacifica SIR-1]